jgi:hypothetical protein
MIQPLVNNAYTDRGNEYKKSNIGKYSAGATVGTGATIIAMKNIPYSKINSSIKNFKKIDFSKVKEIKNVKIKKPSFKGMLQNMFAGIEKLAVKAQIKLATVKPLNIKNIFKKPNFSKDFMPKIKLSEINKAKLMEKLKSPKLVKYSEYAGFVAGAVITGLAIDYVYNKISAYKADKK